MSNNKEFKSGFVSLIGRANVGKSTFLNHVIGKKIAITSNKPQTTRDKISGILTDEEKQLIFVDTPGVHKPMHELDNRMQDTSFNASRGVDAIIFMTTPLKKVLHGDEIILDNLRGTQTPVFLVINKVDQLKKMSDIDETILLYKDLFPFAGIFPISVLEDTNVDILINEILKYIPEGPLLYPDDIISDKNERFTVGELIREKVLLLTEEEVPHSIAVVVDSMKQCEENPNYMDIYATIVCERDSQKKIIIGKNGERIKQIKEKSKNDIRHFLDCKVHLDLWVKVKKDWRNRPKDLNMLGYVKDNY